MAGPCSLARQVSRALPLVLFRVIVMSDMRRTLVTVAFALALSCSMTAQRANAQEPTPAPAAAAEPYVVEYYYKVKWGHQDEFIELFKKNHYPILKRLRAMGYIREISAAFPVNHAGEDDRWDLRITIMFRDALAALPDSAVDGPIVKALYPDQKKFKQEEQRRFELIVEHMDVPVFVDDLKDWE